MKQGTGRTTHSAQKVEPKSRAVSVGKVAGIGIQEIRYRQPGGDGKGYSAPMAGKSTHPRGTQGKH